MNHFILFFLCAGVVLGAIDRNNALQDLSNTNCNPNSFSACATRNVMLLVTQVLQDLNASRFTAGAFPRIFAQVNTDNLAYRLGTGFTVHVFNENGTILASGYDRTLVGQQIGNGFASRSMVTSVNLPTQFLEAAAASGAWVDDVYYIYNGSSATIPTTRKTWVSGVVINGTLYGAASYFDNVDPKQIGRPCDSTKFSDCSLGVAQNLADLVSREVQNLIPSQMTPYFTFLPNNGKYSPPVGFAVTVVRARDGLIVGHSGAGSHVGKNINTLDATLSATIAQAWADGGIWFVHQWREAGASFERQSIVRRAQPIDGETYYIISGYGTTSESKCPPCVCPVCPAVTPCPACPQITSCDGTEVTKLKLDFKEMF